MRAERRICVDHATIHRWAVHYAPRPLEQFNRRKRPVTGMPMQPPSRSRAARCTFSAPSIAMATPSSPGSASGSDLAAAKRFLRKALNCHGRPERIVIDGSQADRDTIVM
jgi:transposase-like protein